ncbi:TonB-dependent receptor [Puia sp.]|jgi:TonB-linked SusC/RagA family outer membrane protein|uniref:SusC/RagA family TonB-linked outer membrane protein n=1 Tax=Puia sp. TaxID=2045100 RepID=UPI002F3E4E59
MSPKLTKTILGLLSVALILSLPLAAQPPAHRLTGRVSAQSSGASVPGASITVKGTKNSVQTDADGNFTITVAPNEVLVISTVGYVAKEVRVGTSATLNISLNQDYSSLNDVVVVGYGRMKKSDMSAAVGTISAADLDRTVNVTLDEALQGKAANVYVSQTSGQPGAGASVIIRGVSTVTGNYQPLYVIDGVQIRPSLPTGGAYNSTPNLANELQGLNPDDIENISVLEGPAATSIYGAAGANGVIMITTKQGKAGNTRVTVNELQSLQTRPKNQPVMNLRDYAVYVQKLENLGLVPKEPDELSDPSLLGPGTDWQHALFQNTWMQKHSLAVSGGTDRTTFYLSGEYTNQNGIAIGSGFQRGSLRFNLANQASKWLKISTNLNIFDTKEKVNIFQANIVNVALSQNPTIPVKNPDGTFGGPSAAQAQYSATNPVALANLNNNYNTSFGAIGGLNLDITPIKGLLWHTEVNGNYTFNNGYTFNPSYTIGAYVNPNTTGSRNSANNWWASLNTRIQYDWTLGKHAASIMAGHEAQQYAYQSLSANGQGYTTNTVQELSVASTVVSNPSSSRGDGSQESYFARANYTYDNKYIAQVVVRHDGSSNFGPNNRFGTFPAASLAWKISDEKFMQGISWLNDLKLRGEYGISGNAGPGGAIYSNLYASITVWGGGFLPGNYPNANLKWEQDKAGNVGFDAHLFNNRVEIIADAYQKKISNLILPASGPSYLGGYLSGGYGGQLSWPIENYGGMENKGFGVTVNTVNISTKDFQWKTGVNFSMDRNKVTRLYAPIYTQYYSTTNSRQAEFLTKVGQPLSTITGYVADGLFQNYKDIAGHAIQTSNSKMTVDPAQGSWVGDIKFRDINKDGFVDNNDRTIIGNPWPKFSYNFTSTFDYKGFELSLFFTGVYGNKILNLTRYENEYIPLGTGPYANHFRSDVNFAVPSSIAAADALTATLTNPGYKIARPSASDANGNARLSQWSVESGSYIKLKNARLSWRLPAKYVNATHFLRGVVFTAQAQNVFTVTKYTGYDPEIGMYSYGGFNIVGMDEGRYPQTRSYVFSVAVNF